MLQVLALAAAHRGGRGAGKGWSRADHEGKGEEGREGRRVTVRDGMRAKCEVKGRRDLTWASVREEKGRQG